MLFSLEDQFGQYGAYHTNPLNIAVHVIFVPLILWSWTLFITFFLPAPASLDYITYQITPYLRIEPSAGFIWGLLYIIYFFTLEPIAATLYLPFIGSLILNSTALGKSASNIPLAIGAFFTSWIVQFLSHAFIEGRAPALLDNVANALVLAPFFAFFHVLDLFGYRPELQKKLHAAVEKNEAMVEAKLKAAKEGKKDL